MDVPLSINLGTCCTIKPHGTCNWDPMLPIQIPGWALPLRFLVTFNVAHGMFAYDVFEEFTQHTRE